MDFQKTILWNAGIMWLYDLIVLRVRCSILIVYFCLSGEIRISVILFYQEYLLISKNQYLYLIESKDFIRFKLSKYLDYGIFYISAWSKNIWKLQIIIFNYLQFKMILRIIFENRESF